MAAESGHRGEAICKVVGFIVDEILRVGFKNDSHWSMKYRSRSVGQCGCRVGTSRRSLM